jgi:hypothetical protein
MSARLAFCNDTEYMAWNAYKEIHHVLYEELGVEIEDSFWLFDPNGSDMALFARDIHEKGKYHDELMQEIKQGHLTILHSAGFFSNLNTPVSPTRELIHEGLAYLAQYACVPRIWTNHGDYGDIQNIGGANRHYHQGDDPAGDCYILDLLLQYGVQYFWTDIDASNDFVFTDSSGCNPLIHDVVTDSGHRIHTFKRFRGALPKAPDAQTLSLQLTAGNLSQLVEENGACVIYQHWGVHRDDKKEPYSASSPVFPSTSVDSLKLLRKYVEQKKLEIVPLLALLESIN